MTIKNEKRGALVTQDTIPVSIKLCGLNIFDIIVFSCLNIIYVKTDRVFYDKIHLFTLV